MTRLKPGKNETDKALKNSIRNLLEQLGEIDDKMLVSEAINGAPLSVESEVNELQSLPGTSVPVHNKLFVPVLKWNIHFSEDINDKEALSANAFIERIEEYREARGVSEGELIKSLCDLLKGSTINYLR